MERVNLAIGQWLELVDRGEGVGIPTWVRVVSNSMYPFIRAHSDRVLLVPAGPDDVSVGDIVLFPVRHANGDYCLHHLYRMDGNMVQTMGDANERPDGWLPRDSILGKVVLIQRGSLTIDCKSRTWGAIFRAWNLFWKIRPAILLPLRFAGRCKTWARAIRDVVNVGLN